MAQPYSNSRTLDPYTTAGGASPRCRRTVRHVSLKSSANMRERSKLPRNVRSSAPDTTLVITQSLPLVHIRPRIVVDSLSSQREQELGQGIFELVEGIAFLRFSSLSDQSQRGFPPSLPLMVPLSALPLATPFAHSPLPLSSPESCDCSRSRSLHCVSTHLPIRHSRGHAQAAPRPPIVQSHRNSQFLAACVHVWHGDSVQSGGGL